MPCLLLRNDSEGKEPLTQSWPAFIQWMQLRLTDGVVDLVGARVSQLFTLEPNPRKTWPWVKIPYPQ